eukprot:TRINITY_DN262_c0_g1_i18.p1 TRINITY_DN262_c0_g1~~TRINITY_DN262_c0_g1_i18.p1  ORF type:complete len:520 (+),score=166.32 TRINITY_DN262_c0_g1_i18:16-1575(+)
MYIYHPFKAAFPNNPSTPLSPLSVSEEQQVNIEEPQDQELQEPEKEAEKFSLPILSIVVTSQQENGLRYSDYLRYRQYCTRRLYRIRKSTKKLNAGSKGRFRDNPVVAEHVKSERELMIPLVSAERAWAYSMQLKEESEENARARFHSLARLKKTVRFSQALKALCDEVADERTILEADAYLSAHQANLALILDDFQPALVAYMRAQTIYEQLSKVGRLEDQELYKQRVEDLVPSIRYCNYNLQKELGTNDPEALKELLSGSNAPGLDLLRDQLDNVMTEIRKDMAEKMDEVVFCGSSIPIKDESVRMGILTAQDAQFNLNERVGIQIGINSSVGIGEGTASSSSSDDEEQTTGGDGSLDDEGFTTTMELYDKVFAAYNETLKTIRETIVSENKKKKDQNVAYLRRLDDYVNSLMLENSISRNQFLAKTLKNKMNGTFVYPSGKTEKAPKAMDLVRVYEGMVQNLNELDELIGEEGLGTEGTKKMAARKLTFKAIRCQWMMQSYVKRAEKETKMIFQND